MKLSTACAVFAAFAAAAAPARANPLVSTTVSFTDEVFNQLFKNLELVKKRNSSFFLTALNDLSSELQEDLDFNVFKITSDVNKILIDAELKIGQIYRKIYSFLSQIEYAPQIIMMLHSSNARFELNIRGNHIKTICQNTSAMTNDVLRLIEETNDMIGKGVSGPLKILQVTVALMADNRISRELANIELQQNIINNPPRNLLNYIDYDTVRAAKTLKRNSKNSVIRIENLVKSIFNHAKWLDGICLTIREELENEFIDFQVMHGKVKGAKETIDAITSAYEDLYIQNMGDEYSREASKVMVQVMTDLRDEVFNITTNRIRRAAG